MSERTVEIQEKLAKLRRIVTEKGFDGVRLTAIHNAAWVTAGAATYVNEGTDSGAASILVTADHAVVVADSIETPRLTDEEHLAALGFEFRTKVWHSADDPAADLVAGKRIATDSDLTAELLTLRSNLTAGEMERFRAVGTLAGEAMNEAIQRVRPGQTEYQLAGFLAEAVRARGGSPIVNLIASDDRIYRYRHPLPTAKQVEKYAMLVLCMRMGGLVASVTRLVHFGPIPSDLHTRAAAVTEVDAALILESQPGRTLADLFGIAKAHYERLGYTGAIDEHHQGGTAAYQPRETVATPHTHAPITTGQAFAWNPSVSGNKSEDTFLLTENGPDVITKIEGWPVKAVQIGDRSIERPLILEA